MNKSRHNTRQTHGDTGTRLYNIWHSMKQRTNNPKTIVSKYYHDKGIIVCKSWCSYENFKKWSLANGFDKNLTLDRINNEKGYSPDNCRWVTWEIQENNRTNNHVIVYNGETKTLSQWARFLGFKPKTLSRRIVDKHWDIETAFTTPLLKQYVK